MRPVRYPKRTVVLVMAAAGFIAWAPGSEGFACGYEDPKSVSRGSLSWGYPDSLHVIGAISREVAARRLPQANFNRGGVDLFGNKFGLAKKSLEQFGAMLSAASTESWTTSVTIVLLEPMLWSRFEPTAEGFRTAVHVSGAEDGDLVVVTGEAVIAEIAAGHLTFGEAYARGVARLYGEDARIAAFVLNYQRVGADLGTLETAPSRTAAGLNLQNRSAARQSGTANHRGRKSCEC
ncbi:hypothetical protein [Mesorhizobium ventifaucium]|uniref:Uncharacterized protein n=1 Tax=Mesorhizobium ventifaucium TaxID=666020 RepID=A0ABM9E1Q4_9HYPH|nr:hypothetical protein [Mesorhizobium ventifaucium]CAH2402997.1 conserved exported hypothetical protein [Mesorhizobium ventifaucium]